MKLLVPVAAGLEGIVQAQLLTLGYPKAPATFGRLALEGDWRDVARLNVFLRSGERVLIELAKFRAETFDELFEGFFAIPWEDWLETDSRILMDGKSRDSKLAAIKAAGAVAKKAVIKRLSAHKRFRRQTLSETGARTVIGFSVYRDEVSVTVDTSGDGLHKRGYRSLAYTAPLKETLAAAIIDLSFYRPDKDAAKPFADVFCGSGTLPIEAAMKALNIAPGVRRDFDFSRWACAPKTALIQAKEEARDLERRDRQVCIYGSDVSKEAISIAKYHARQAGAERAIKWSVSDMRNFKSEQAYGVMICNPPYGERLSDTEEVKSLYKGFGKMFFSLENWSAYALTSFPDFERYFGKRADRVKRLSNANLPCNLYTYFGKKPTAPCFFNATLR